MKWHLDTCQKKNFFAKLYWTFQILTRQIRTVLETKQKELVGLKQQHESKTQEIVKTTEVIKKLTADVAAKDVEIKNFHEKIKVTQEYVLGIVAIFHLNFLIRQIMVGEKNINTFTTQIESFNGQLVELNQKRTTLVTNIDQTKNNIKNLNGALQGAQDKQKALEGKNSWIFFSLNKTNNLSAQRVEAEKSKQVTTAKIQSLKNQRQQLVEQHKQLKKKWKEVVKQSEGIQHRLSIASQSVAELQRTKNPTKFQF